MSEPEGGSGGSCRPGRGIRETRLVERAIRERWPIPTKIRRPLIERLFEIIEDTESSPREVTSAAKAILSASKLNLESIAATMKAQNHEEFEDRLTALEEQTETPGPSNLPRRIVIPDVDNRFARTQPPPALDD